ncbi:MAG: MATE family efflux transporter [Syntrophomonadaceae bacterium]|nr:MATE family efflux transporter [Syntrophomonadaceae bacterium]
MINKNNLLANEHVGRLMVRLSFPAIAGMIMYSLFSLIDTVFVSRLGTAALAALTLCVPIEILLVSVGSATGVGITSLLSRTLGKRDFSGADNIAWHGLLICIIYGLFFSWLGLVNLDALLHLFGCPPEIWDLSREYLFIVLLGCLFTFGPMLAGNILQGEGNTLMPMLTALVGIILNVILDPILIFGMGPVPAMGLRGAAWATVGAQLVCTVIALTVMVKQRVFLSWSILNFRPSLSIMIDIYRVGIPTLLMELLSVVIMVFFNKILLQFGYAAVAVMGIFVRIRSLFYMPVFGLAQGAMPMVGFAYGANNYVRVKETIIKAMVFSILFVVIGWWAMQFHPVWLMQRFSGDEKLIALGVDCMRWATLCLPVMGPILILGSVLQALGRGMTAMWLSLIRQLGIFLPALIILPRIWQLNGIWLAFSLAEALSAILALYFLISLWRDLQGNRKYGFFITFKNGYVLRRLAAWLRW